MQTVAIESIKNEKLKNQIKALIDLGGTATTEELMTVLEGEDSPKAISGRFTGYLRAHPGVLTFDRKTGYTWIGTTSANVIPEEERVPELTKKQIRALIDLGGTATMDEIAKKLGSNDRLAIRNRFIAYNTKHPKAITHDPKTGYTWTGEKDIFLETVKKTPVKEEPKEEKVSVKNSSGYSDPTMAAAINRAEPVSKTKPGEIWGFERPCYRAGDPSDERFLILNPFNGFASCLLLIAADEFYNPAYCVPITLKGKMYYVDVRKVYCKSERGFRWRYEGISEVMFNDIKKMTSAMLGLNGIIEKRVEIKVPVEKIVEKTVEVPVEVEKIVEKTVEVPTIPEVDLAVLKEKARIWEEAFKLMCERAS